MENTSKRHKSLGVQLSKPISNAKFLKIYAFEVLYHFEAFPVFLSIRSHSMQETSAIEA